MRVGRRDAGGAGGRAAVSDRNATTSRWGARGARRVGLATLLALCGPGWSAAEQAPVLEPAPPVAAPTDEAFTPLFYKGQDYGSESQFGPLNVFTNVGLGVVGRAGLNASARLGDIDLEQGFGHLGDAYFHPARSIREGYGNVGVWAFLEFVPVLSEISYPNYALHFLGEGMLTRKLEEYYRTEGMSPGWARAAAITTMVLSQQMNELVEAQTTQPADTTADLIFNTAGIIAFCFDGFAEVFANDAIHLYYWPGQPVVDMRDGVLFNHAEDYLLRITLGDWTRWKLATLFGVSTIGLGVSTPIGGDQYITWGLIAGGAGVPPRDYERPTTGPIFYWDPDKEELEVPEREAQSHEVASLRLAWDREGSLLATLDVNPEGDHVGLNVYPGAFDTGPVQLGAYGLWTRGGATALGLTVSVSSVMPGLRF